jgi:hypothetical protein
MFADPRPHVSCPHVSWLSAIIRPIRGCAVSFHVPDMIPSLLAQARTTTGASVAAVYVARRPAARTALKRLTDASRGIGSKADIPSVTGPLPRSPPILNLLSELDKTGISVRPAPVRARRRSLETGKFPGMGSEKHQLVAQDLTKPFHPF